jgi:hypothetical protein
VFSKDLYSRHLNCKNQGLFGKGLIFVLGWLKNIVEKEENAGTSIFSFFDNVFIGFFLEVMKRF